jgi:predicted PhzF superfamily epimerase YddE/YHI9
MGRPSTIQMSARKRSGRVEAVEVGGPVVIVGEGQLHVP